jgi:hypothetical protein
MLISYCTEYFKSTEIFHHEVALKIFSNIFRRKGKAQKYYQNFPNEIICGCKNRTPDNLIIKMGIP